MQKYEPAILIKAIYNTLYKKTDMNTKKKLIIILNKNKKCLTKSVVEYYVRVFYWCNYWVFQNNSIFFENTT